MTDGERLHPEFADLWPGSQGRVSAALEVLERAVEAAGADALDEPLRAEAQARAHKLVGTLGTYGLVRTADAARALEEALAAPGRPDPGELRTLLERVRRGVRDAA